VSRPVVAAAALACALAAGCSTKAPAYHPSLENVQALQSVAPAKVSVGSVKADEKSAGRSTGCAPISPRRASSTRRRRERSTP
jgi:hypothetical protein